MLPPPAVPHPRRGTVNLPEPRQRGRGGPKRGYKWRDAWPGNDLATKHGAHSTAKVAPLAAIKRDENLARFPWLGESEFLPQAASLSIAEAKIELLEGWLAE